VGTGLATLYDVLEPEPEAAKRMLTTWWILRGAPPARLKGGVAAITKLGSSVGIGLSARKRSTVGEAFGFNRRSRPF
jgi:hypothetical protein